MSKLKDFLIPFVGLKDGNHEYRFEMDHSFFEHFSFSDINEGKVQANVVLIKAASILNFEIILNGEVELPCDRCGDNYYQPVKNIFHLVVNTNGEVFNDEDDLVTLPSGAYEFDLSQYIFEYIILSLPSKKVCENAIGAHKRTCDPVVIARLKDFREEEKPKEKTEIDPRWDALKNVKFKK